MWLHIPQNLSTSCPCAPESAGLTSDLDSLARMLAQSATWRGKSSAPRYWLGRLKTVGWMMHLSGLTLKPSMVSRGVESWIASLADTRASLLVYRENDRARQTPATSGQILPVLWLKFSPPSASSRTYQGIYLWDSRRSPRNLKTWATALRQESSRRQKSVRLMSARDCSYWRTPKHNTRAACTKETLDRRIADNLDITIHDQAVHLWPTVCASHYKGHSLQEVKKGNPKRRLHVEAVSHPTLTAIGNPSQITLNPQFTEWLMGLPIGWTDWPPLAMPYVQWQQQMRSQLCWAQSITEPEPEQMELEL